ncbi:hypothetical protein O3M35_009269 [Rhynocoris fuscipes]|uniref:Uncharacterized protein n=1 Tax=Rhynocoris fuscipes TaxID=488301 RepID=A0AAW1D898_9HEMI
MRSFFNVAANCPYGVSVYWYMCVNLITFTLNSYVFIIKEVNQAGHNTLLCHLSQYPDIIYRIRYLGGQFM